MDQYSFKIRDAVVAAEEELSFHFLICLFISLLLTGWLELEGKQGLFCASLLQRVHEEQHPDPNSQR